MPENVPINLNIEAMRQEARQQFYNEHAKRRTFRELIEASVPNWLIIVALALFALSAPHTTEMFNKITPGFGLAGVLLCEFGLLYIAFRRKMEQKNDGKLPAVIFGLEVLLFLTAILVNGAGALIAVVSLTGNDQLSLQLLRERFDTMNVTSQVSLFLVPLSALIIPIGTVVAGEGLAALILQGKKDQSDLEQEWLAVQQINVRSLVYSRLLEAGFNARDAGRKATSMTANLLARPEKADAERTDERTAKRTRGKSSSGKRRADARMAIREYFSNNPDVARKSVRQIERDTGISRTVVSEELRIWKAEHGLDPEDTQPSESESVEVN